MLNNNEATPSGEKVFIRKPVNDFLSVVLWHILYNSHRFSSYSPYSDLMATETPPSGENIFIRKPDLDFLLVVCWHILPKSYRFRVIRVNSIWPLQRRPLAEKIILFESPSPTSY
jgi:hypothetical protein